jgi:serine/threonine-protein kinase HSL1, negative regulator of Swe1 kinase
MLVQESHKRSPSQFTIMNNEHLYSKHSFYEPPPSDDSYDPFRASRDPVFSGKSITASVTVHRGTSSASTTHKANTAHGANSLRIQALRKSSKRCSSGLSNPQSGSSPITRKSIASQRRSVSRASLGSSMFPSSPPVIVTAKPSYKRGVSFMHLHRSSALSSLAMSDVASDAMDVTPEQQRVAEPALGPPEQSIQWSHKPNNLSNTELIAVRATAHNLTTPGNKRLKLNKPPQSQRHLIEKEARIVSSELDKLCEEAFFRSSISSKTSNLMTDKPRTHSETSPSSLNDGNSGVSDTANGFSSSPFNQNNFSSRPLPPVPVETPNTFIARELAETRARLAKRCEEEGDTTASFDAVLAHLDQLLHPKSILSVPPVQAAKRAASVPHPKHPDYMGHLPVISEEGKISDGNIDGKRNRGYRSVTDPVWPSSPPHEPVSRKPVVRNLRRVDETSSTIRVVDQPSPTPVAPLNIRKRSGASTISRTQTNNVPSAAAITTSLPTAPATRGVVAGTMKGALPSHQQRNLGHIDGRDDQDGNKKKRTWFFGRKNRETKTDLEINHNIPAAWADLDDRMTKVPRMNQDIEASRHNRWTSGSLSSSAASAEFSMRPSLQPPPVPPPRKGFLRFFSKFGPKPDVTTLGFECKFHLYFVLPLTSLISFLISLFPLLSTKVPTSHSLPNTVLSSPSQIPSIPHLSLLTSNFNQLPTASPPPPPTPHTSSPPTPQPQRAPTTTRTSTTTRATGWRASCT